MVPRIVTHVRSMLYLICTLRVSVNKRQRTAPTPSAVPDRISGKVGEPSLISPKETLPRIAPIRPMAARNPNAAPRLLWVRQWRKKCEKGKRRQIAEKQRYTVRHCTARHISRDCPLFQWSRSLNNTTLNPHMSDVYLYLSLHILTRAGHVL